MKKNKPDDRSKWKLPISYQEPHRFPRLFQSKTPSALTEEDKQVLAEGFSLSGSRLDEVFTSHKSILREYLNLLPIEYGRPTKDEQNDALDALKMHSGRLIDELKNIHPQLRNILEIRLRSYTGDSGSSKGRLDEILAVVVKLHEAATRAHSRNAGKSFRGYVKPGKPNSKKYTVSPHLAQAIAPPDRLKEFILAPIEILVNELSCKWQELTGRSLSRGDKPFKKGRDTFTARQYVHFIVEKIHPEFTEDDARNAIAAWQARRRQEARQAESERDAEGADGEE